TLGKVFPNRFVISADSMIVLGSQKPILSEELMKNFDEKNVHASYFTRFHLKDALDQEKQDYIYGMLDKKIPINTDLSPYAFVYYLLVEQTKFYPGLSVPVEPLKANVLIFSMIMIAALGLLLSRNNGVPLVANAALFGFLAIGFSAIIYFIFQITCGALFWKLGILVGLFMAGLSLGSLIAGQIILEFEINQKWLGWLLILWLAFCAEIFFWLNFSGHSILFELTWFTLSLECGILTGAGYPMLTNLWKKNKNTDTLKVVSFVYALDLAGAFLGTLLFSILFIPFLGIHFALLLLFFLIVIAGTNMLR
ncbi:MAG: hypothetical protein NT079_00635, partial [Candidatus Omnitrophica bacterium]|nr:hypothetical protein [Candidatus Omnitrophota bacterium]